MISLITSQKALEKLAENIRDLRLKKGFTQKGLADRSGVALASLRKFEQTGAISLESFLKLCMTLGYLEKVIDATKAEAKAFTSIDDVLKDKKEAKKPQRGWRK